MIPFLCRRRHLQRSSGRPSSSTLHAQQIVWDRVRWDYPQDSLHAREKGRFAEHGGNRGELGRVMRRFDGAFLFAVATHCAGILPWFQVNLHCRRMGSCQSEPRRGASLRLRPKSVQSQSNTPQHRTVRSMVQVLTGNFWAEMGSATDSASVKGQCEGYGKRRGWVQRISIKPSKENQGRSSTAQNLQTHRPSATKNGDFSGRSSPWLRCSDAGPRLACRGRPPISREFVLPLSFMQHALDVGECAEVRW